MRLRTTVMAAAGLAFCAVSTGPVMGQEQMPPPQSDSKLTDREILALFTYAHTAQISTGRIAQEKGKAAQVKDMARSFIQSHVQLRDQSRSLAERLQLTDPPKAPPMEPEPQPVPEPEPEPVPPEPPVPQPEPVPPEPQPEPAPPEPEPVPEQEQDPWQEENAARGELPEAVRNHALVETQRSAMDDLRAKTGDEFDERYVNYEIEFHEKAIAALNEELIPAAENEELKMFLQNAVPGFEAHLARAKDVRERIIAANTRR